MSGDTVRVVIADDELVIRNLVSSILRDAGFELVGVAADGAEAVSLCRQLKPDVLLLDIHMPGMSGIKVLDVLSKGDLMPVVIMLTAEGQSDIVDDCLKYGVKRRAHKGTSIAKLPEIIREAFAEQQKGA